MKRNPNYWMLLALFALAALVACMAPSGNTSPPERNDVIAIGNAPPDMPVAVVSEDLHTMNVSWIAFSMPGDTRTQSSDGIIWEDTPEVECNIYYTIDQPDLTPNISPGYPKEILKYPFDSGGCKQS